MMARRWGYLEKWGCLNLYEEKPLCNENKKKE
jgi:hypothetical protein